MRRILITAILLGICGAANGAATTQPGEVDAAALVREVRQAENWVERAKSLHLKLAVKIEYSPQTAARNFTGAYHDETLELAFDASRMYLAQLRDSNGTNPYSSTSVWDGRHFTQFGRMSGPVKQLILSYVLADDADSLTSTYLASIPWLRAGVHRYWWSSPTETGASIIGDSPDEYSLAGRSDFRGHDCYELKSDHVRGHSLFVGTGDHRLYGISIVKFTTDYYGDYKEIAPGCWMPMTMGYAVDGSSQSAGTKFDMAVTLAVKDQPLPEELFKVDIPEGQAVYDTRYFPPLRYPYKKEMTKAEFDELVYFSTIKRT